MRSSAKWGRVLAIAFLVMLYPSISVLFHGRPTAIQVAGIVALVAALATIYSAFWLWGLRNRSWRVTTAVVAGLVILAVLVNVVSGVWTINTFLYSLVVAGFAYPPRLAVAAVLGLITLGMAVSLPAVGALGLPSSDVVALVLITVAQLLLIGFGAIGGAWLVRTIEELRAARERLAQLAVEQERARFARDVHDLMGHSLSVITLKGELATQLIDTAPEQAASEVRDIVRVARNALREVREAVSGYRQPTLAGELAGARAALAAGGIDAPSISQPAR